MSQVNQRPKDDISDDGKEEKQQTEPSTWKCKLCTLENPSTQLFCTACRQPQGAHHGAQGKVVPAPPYKPTIAKYSKTDINEPENLPAIYTKSWSDVLIDIITHYCRSNNILQTLEYQIPKIVFEVISSFYTNDKTHHRSYNDYINALLICKYFSFLKDSKRASLNDSDKSIKKKYGLLKKSSLTPKKVFKALTDFNSGAFEMNTANILEDFEVYFVDNIQNKCNLKRYSYPKNSEYKMSKDELNIIAAIRDTQEINKSNPMIVFGKVTAFYRSSELITILQKMYFKTGKESIRLHTIVEYRDKALFAIDYNNEYAYFLFVFRFFTIVIHDKLIGRAIIARTMQAKAMASKYRGILEQFDQSGL